MTLRNKTTNVFDYFIPKYTEATMFLTSLATFLLFVMETSLREGIIDIFISDFFIAVIILFISLGFFLCIYYAFNEKIIIKQNKDFMLVFVIVINVFVGMNATFYLMDTASGLNIIFPLVNYFNALFLAFAFRHNIINANSILDVQAKKSEILIGSILVIVIFFYSKYILGNHWALTFSICLVYTTNINNIIRKLLFRK